MERSEARTTNVLLRPVEAAAQIRLLGEFELCYRLPIVLPRSAQRLVAFLALARRPVRHDRLAGALWSDVGQARADGNLRSALWRLGRRRKGIVTRRADCLSIDPSVKVDAWDVEAIAERVLDAPAEAPVAVLDRLAATMELLADWDESWLTPERERLRQLRLHALERAGEAALRAHDFARAINLGLAAVETDPYRESPYRLLVEAHLEEGNIHEAAREYLAYRRLATEELGITPSTRIEALIGPVRSAVDAFSDAHQWRQPQPRSTARR